jgi:hypothetical protein
MQFSKPQKVSQRSHKSNPKRMGFHSSSRIDRQNAHNCHDSLTCSGNALRADPQYLLDDRNDIVLCERIVQRAAAQDKTTL